MASKLGLANLKLIIFVGMLLVDRKAIKSLVGCLNLGDFLVDSLVLVDWLLYLVAEVKKVSLGAKLPMFKWSISSIHIE